MWLVPWHKTASMWVSVRVFEENEEFEEENSPKKSKFLVSQLLLWLVKSKVESKGRIGMPKHFKNVTFSGQQTCCWNHVSMTTWKYVKAMCWVRIKTRVSNDYRYIVSGKYKWLFMGWEWCRIGTCKLIYSNCSRMGNCPYKYLSFACR